MEAASREKQRLRQTLNSLATTNSMLFMLLSLERTLVRRPCYFLLAVKLDFLHTEGFLSYEILCV